MYIRLEIQLPGFQVISSRFILQFSAKRNVKMVEHAVVPIDVHVRQDFMEGDVKKVCVLFIKST